MPAQDIIPVLQVSVGPVILISGVGLLLLTLTNRLGRAIDRSRQLMGEMRTANDADLRRLLAEVRMLYQRAKIIQGSIALAVLSVLFAAVMIILLFVTALLSWNAVGVVSLLFIGCLLSLIFSLALFLADIRTALHALKLEVANAVPEKR
ncbi:MAG TPA: DUF2721 domain-containing protein [Opitutales bacterium]|jgi:hypothetical protein|nr:DUF2721 domain-containing protein [Opitutales bacterium]